MLGTPDEEGTPLTVKVYGTSFCVGLSGTHMLANVLQMRACIPSHMRRKVGRGYAISPRLLRTSRINSATMLLR